MANFKKSFQIRQWLENEKLWVQLAMRGGLILSTILMVLGISLHLMAGDIRATGISVWSLFDGSLSSGDFFLTLGVLVLAMTPALRILLLMAWWAREKDWLFVGVAMMVTATLAFSVWIS